MAPVESDEEDLTRKERREAARAQRKAAEEAELTRAKRRTRMTQLGIVVAIVVVAIVGIAIAAGGGGGKSSNISHSKTEANAKVTQVSALLNGIPQSGTVLGSPNAPVTLVYFGDLECPICKEFTLGALPTLIQKYVRAGKLRIEYKALETATREPETFKQQQIAAMAAGKQQKAWNYIELFYHEQGQEDSGYVTENYLQKLASSTPGLNIPTWEEDRKDPAFENAITTDKQLASNEGFNGTPSFLIGHTGGKLEKLGEESLTDPSGFESAIESKLKG
jgi:protein-disulfide isomerase